MCIDKYIHISKKKKIKLQSYRHVDYFDENRQVLNKLENIQRSFSAII